MTEIFWTLLTSTSERKGLLDISIPKISPLLPSCMAFCLLLDHFLHAAPAMIFAKLAHCTNHWSGVRGAGKKLRSEAHKRAALKLVPSVDMLRHLVGSRVTNRPVKGSIRPEDDALRRIANGEPIDSLLLNFSWTSYTCSKLILSRQTFSATWGRYLAYFGFMNFMNQFKNSICIHPISLIN